MFNRNISALTNSDMTFRAIFEVMFSYEDHAAYEIVENYEVQQVSYAELKARIETFSSYLKSAFPHVSGEFIGLDLPNGPEFLVAFWAILQSGNKPYLINSYYPDQLRNDLLNRLGSQIVITCSEGYEGFARINPNTYDSSTIANSADNDEKALLGNDEKALLGNDGENVAVTWGDEIALSSSLTDLRASICVYDGASFSQQILNAVGILKKNSWLMKRYNGATKIIAILPFFHIFGVVVSYFWLAFFGRTIVFLKDYSPETIRSTVNRHKVTHVFAPPVLYHRMHKGIMNSISQDTEKRKKRFNKALRIATTLQDIAPGLGISVSKWMFKEVINATLGPSVKFMISGGAFIDTDTLRLINTIGYPLFNGYGTTETSITSVELRKRLKHRASGSIGVPFDSVSYAIGDDSTCTVSGTTICKKIITFDSEKTGFDSIQTNDLMRLADGQYYIEGRGTDLFIGESGENINPDLIQNALTVKNASAISVLDLDGALSLVLEYSELLPELIIKKEAEKTRQDLESIPYGLMVKELYITRDRITNESSIKTSRALLKKMVAEGSVRLVRYQDLTGELGKVDSLDEDPIVILIKGIVQRAIDTSDDIDINDHFFFDLGGTSLDYFMMMSEISSVFNTQINLEKRNNLYTVADIHTYVMEVI